VVQIGESQIVTGHREHGVHQAAIAVRHPFGVVAARPGVKLKLCPVLCAFLDAFLLSHEAVLVHCATPTLTLHIA